MPNQMTSLTDPQRLAMLLQSTDQNQVMPQQAIPSQGGGGNPFAPATQFMMNRLMMNKGNTGGMFGGGQGSNINWNNSNTGWNPPGAAWNFGQD